MTDGGGIFASTLFGLLLGLLFFGGLAWTISRGLKSKRPAVVFGLSFLIRMGVVVSGFLWVASSHEWWRIVSCLFGYVLSRYLCGYGVKKGGEDGIKS